MNLPLSRTRRSARNASRLGATLSAAMLLVSLTSAFGGTSHVTAAGVDSGAVQLYTPLTAANPDQVLTSGTSATVLSMKAPAGASCAGSGSGTPPYRWQTFMVAASVDVATLTYASGPAAVGSAFVSPMYDSSTGDPVINKNPSASPLGLISSVPTMSFAALIGFVPAGEYKIGFACTLAGATDNFWSMQIAVTTTESPAALAWTVSTPTVVTTTTTVAATTTSMAATTTTRPATTTTSAATTTTTTASSATTTTAAAVTTTTVVGSATVTTTNSGFGASPTAPTGGRLAATGTSSMSLVIWAILLLVCGRMAILFARPVRVQRSDTQ